MTTSQDNNELDPRADELDGTELIGEWLNKTSREAEYLCSTGQIPAFKRGGRWVLRKSRYYRHVEAQEDATLARRVLADS